MKAAEGRIFLPGCWNTCQSTFQFHRVSAGMLIAHPLRRKSSMWSQLRRLRGMGLLPVSWKRREQTYNAADACDGTTPHICMLRMKHACRTLAGNNSYHG